MLQNIYSIGQLSHKALLFLRSEVDFSQPAYFSMYAKVKVSEASAEHEGCEQSEPNEDVFFSFPTSRPVLS